jgi:hypothetical protein
MAYAVLPKAKQSARASMTAAQVCAEMASVAPPVERAPPTALRIVARIAEMEPVT